MKKHEHYWREFDKSDATGGFVYCRCNEIRFLPDKEMKKMKKYLRQGYKGNQLII